MFVDLWENYILSQKLSLKPLLFNIDKKKRGRPKRWRVRNSIETNISERYRGFDKLISKIWYWYFVQTKYCVHTTLLVIWTGSTPGLVVLLRHLLATLFVTSWYFKTTSQPLNWWLNSQQVDERTLAAHSHHTTELTRVVFTYYVHFKGGSRVYLVYPSIDTINILGKNEKKIIFIS